MPEIAGSPLAGLPKTASALLPEPVPCPNCTVDLGEHALEDLLAPFRGDRSKGKGLTVVHLLQALKAGAFDEVLPTLSVLLRGPPVSGPPRTSLTPPWVFVYVVLGALSRSFNLTILTLPERLRNDVSLFYVVLRALDTIEDDPELALPAKCTLLQNFVGLLKPGVCLCSLKGVGETPTERHLLEHLDVVRTCLYDTNTITTGSREIICEVTAEMATGMALRQNDTRAWLKTWEDYDQYCYYVAGVVGLGLTRLFVSSGAELPRYFAGARDDALAIGRFLQKTNIIRDFREDLDQGRVWWPEVAWGGPPTSPPSSPKSLPIRRPQDLTLPENWALALHALSCLIGNALQDLPRCIVYLSNLESVRVLRFCAINQLLALATLIQCYRNPAIFSSSTPIKVRRSFVVSVFLQLTSFSRVVTLFVRLAKALRARVDLTRDSHARPLIKVLDGFIQQCDKLSPGLVRQRRVGL